jgi:hypothetical protein
MERLLRMLILVWVTWVSSLGCAHHCQDSTALWSKYPEIPKYARQVGGYYKVSGIIRGRADGFGHLLILGHERPNWSALRERITYQDFFGEPCWRTEITPSCNLLLNKHSRPPASLQNFYSAIAYIKAVIRYDPTSFSRTGCYENVTIVALQAIEEIPEEGLIRRRE